MKNKRKSTNNEKRITAKNQSIIIKIAEKTSIWLYRSENSEKDEKLKREIEREKGYRIVKRRA